LKNLKEWHLSVAKNAENNCLLTLHNIVVQPDAIGCLWASVGATIRQKRLNVSFLSCREESFKANILYGYCTGSVYGFLKDL
jgi:hypothetical protein